jgi:hypothetical protein
LQSRKSFKLAKQNETKYSQIAKIIFDFGQSKLMSFYPN